ncbi:MAG: NAD-dependent malic enzyme, partial [Gammaproteobacteria bacterium]|nr:NAD-dependent malic enzyme [Gammaproteobacteria bacterium]
MINAAVVALAESVTDAELAVGLMFPATKRLRSVSRSVALAVMECAIAEGGADPGIAALDSAARPGHLDNMIWEPHYRRYTAG